MTTETAVKTKEKIKAPRNFNVVFYNDDKTPFGFVVLMLETYFGKTTEEAHAITDSVHKTGKGIAGTYSKEIAEQKVILVTTDAKANNFPLKAKSEPS